jgi:transposase-like protein
MPKRIYKAWTKAERKALIKTVFTSGKDITAFARQTGRTYSSVTAAYRRFTKKNILESSTASVPSKSKKLGNKQTTYVFKNCKSVEISGNTVIIQI